MVEGILNTSRIPQPEDGVIQILSHPAPSLCRAGGKCILPPLNMSFLKGWRESGAVAAPGKVQQFQGVAVDFSVQTGSGKVKPFP